MKKVSVVVVSYNQGEYIRDCIKSILSQTYTNWELIIADDASTDNSTEVYEELVEEYKLNATRIFNKENLGLCRTLNKCLSCCSGEYVKLIAADDWLDENYLEKMVKAFEGESEDLGIIFTNAVFFDENGLTDRRFFSSSPDLNDGWIHEKLLRGNFIPALTAFIKMNVIKSVGLFDENIWIEDWEYWLRASLKFKFKYVDEVLAFYRIHNSNVSKNIDKLVVGELQIILKFGNDFSNRKIVNDQFRERFYLAKNKKQILELFESYQFRNPILLFFFKNNLPRKLYRMVQVATFEKF